MILAAVVKTSMSVSSICFIFPCKADDGEIEWKKNTVENKIATSALDSAIQSSQV
jgi:hypothetical protein